MHAQSMCMHSSIADQAGVRRAQPEEPLVEGGGGTGGRLVRRGDVDEDRREPRPGRLGRVQPTGECVAHHDGQPITHALACAREDRREEARFREAGHPRERLDGRDSGYVRSRVAQQVARDHAAA